MTETQKRWYTLDELAEEWGVSRAYVQCLLVSGELKGFKLARRWRITVDEVLAFEKRLEEKYRGLHK